MEPHLHKVQYYETDKMGITHHSNYIRIIEEARSDFLEKIGYSYKRMESEGLISPTTKIELEYKKSTTYGDIIETTVCVSALTPVRTQFSYTLMCNGNVVCIGKSEHCFLDKSGRVLATKKCCPEFYDLLTHELNKNKDIN